MRSASTQLIAATTSRGDTVRHMAPAAATTTMAGTAVAAESPVTAPRTAIAPTSGATPSCHQKRVRAGASKATNPVIEAPMVIAPVDGVPSSSSTSAAIPTGAATSKPRHSAGPTGPRIRQLVGMSAMRGS